MSKKVLVLGLDGATLDLIVPWVKTGNLPIFAKIMKEGVYGELQSTIHPMSSVAWPSFMTGMNPGKHGIFDVTEQAPNSYEITFTSGASRFGKTMWKILSDAGKKVGIINVPMTYPPEEVNGYLIAGMDSPGIDSNFVYPRELWDEIRKNVGEYVIEHGNPMGNKTLDEFAKDIYHSLDRRYALFNYLRQNYPTDLSVVVFVAPDRSHHFFWKYMEDEKLNKGKSGSSKYHDVIPHVYQRLDTLIGEVIAGLDSNTVLFIMSDHGAGPIRKLVNLNAWLNAQGLLRLKGKTDGKVRPLEQAKKIPFVIARAGWKMLRQYLPDSYRARLRRLLPRTKDRFITYLFLSRIDWSSTKAYSTGYFGDIRINLKGREPQGIVNPGSEYEDLRQEIITRLESLRDPDTGEKMVDKAYKREDLYHGDQVHKASDLIIKWQDYRYKSRINLEMEEKSAASEIMVDPARDSKISSIHKMNGIFMAYGRDMKRGVEISGAKIIDLAPTILYMMDKPIPDSMDGKVLTDILREDFLNKNPIRYRKTEKGDISQQGPAYTDEEADKVRERLQGLGYIE
ncbi:MAG TPA: alkaline phosphatase family protein [Thermodesulfovibrionales bacterium]|nr:alkaline phosphatase family protein [Thermodesulfovibrionales bacterium]